MFRLVVRLLVESGDAVDETDGLPTIMPAAPLLERVTPAAVAAPVLGVTGREPFPLTSFTPPSLAEFTALFVHGRTDTEAVVTTVDDTGLTFASLSKGKEKGAFAEDEAVVVVSDEGTVPLGVAILMGSTFTL